MPEQNSQPDSNEQGTPDALVALRPLWRWKWVIVLVAVIGAAGAYAVTSRRAKQYASSTEVYIEATDPAAAVTSIADGQPPPPPSSQDLANLATLSTQQSVTDAVYRRLGVPVGSAGSIAVAPVVGADGSITSFLVVSALSGSPVLAARLANTYVATFIEQRRNAQLAQATSDVAATRREVAVIPDTPANAQERQALLTEEAQLNTVAKNPSAEASQLDAAPVPGGPVSPRPRRDAILGGIVGLLLGIAAAFGLELLDRRLVGIASVESTYGIPVIAMLPHVRRPSPEVDGHAVVAPAFVEQIRMLRVHLAGAGGSDAPRTILVTSALPGEGKSLVTHDLALAYAEAGERVLVVDADLRRSRIGQLFGVQAGTGLVQVLREEATIADVVIGVQRSPNGQMSRPSDLTAPASATSDRHGQIDLLTYSERIENPLGLLSTDAMSRTLREASANYDVVILDSAPLLAVADTQPVLTMVDAVLLVARLGITTRQSADRVRAVMQRNGANVAGVVATDVGRTLLGDGYRSYGY